MEEEDDYYDSDTCMTDTDAEELAIISSSKSCSSRSTSTKKRRSYKVSEIIMCMHNMLDLVTCACRTDINKLLKAYMPTAHAAPAE